MNQIEIESYMNRCLQLAEQGRGNVAPNPMVGCIIVHNGKIISEGYHEQFGSSHAEVNAIKKIENKKILKHSSLFVNLEPCAHHGKTPPCTDLILQMGISEIYIGSSDPNPIVSGKGIEILKDSGKKVQTGILAKESRELNKRFYTFHEKKRPYVILKWAETVDGFISRFPIPENKNENKITNGEADKLNHQWRSEESAIMVGTNTVLNDNPALTTRLVNGKNPIRVLIDKKGIFQENLQIMKANSKVILFTENESKTEDHIEFVKTDFKVSIIDFVLSELWKRNVQSLIVEGGSVLLNSFLESGLYDEIRILIGNKVFGSGIEAPNVDKSRAIKNFISDNELLTIKNQTNY